MTDSWQLVNGWDVVDWSLNVGGDPAPRRRRGAGRSYGRQVGPVVAGHPRVFGSARAVLTAGIRSEAVGYVIDTEEEDLLILLMLDWP